MAIVTNNSFNTGSGWSRDTSDYLIIPLQAARTWANGDTLRGVHLWKQCKIADAILAIQPIDTNATPTATGALYVADSAGAVLQNLITLAAADMKAGGIFRLNVFAGLGYMVAAEGAYLEFAVTAAVATAASAAVKYGAAVTNLNYPLEDPAR